MPTPMPTEIVTVALGLPKEDDPEHWPATIFEPEQRRVRYQYIGLDTVAEIESQGGMTATYEAQFIGNDWALLRMVV